MTNLPNLSPRARKALDILADGGEFAYRLERNNYTGREQFAARLKDAAGAAVRGFSYAVFNELKNAGFLMPYHWTSVGTYYRMNKGA